MCTGFRCDKVAFESVDDGWEDVAHSHERSRYLLRLAIFDGHRLVILTFDTRIGSGQMTVIRLPRTSRSLSSIRAR